ncbi:uncharacterized protein DEA37_0012880 [Paragonimus westermani]|uniref:Uncharacterized protein n=1 Tax=Paragonimus westermani TaxID=34504 RepID=A0A5J4NLI7_9TREM|nr:uncharacterized protein DEA37_0012880 [Paragonimus westermani]
MDSVGIVLFVCIVFFHLADSHFEFPRFHYKKKAGNQRVFREIESACAASCSPDLSELERKKCARLCISRDCYEKLYSFDELEEGEIDVRAEHFKGCVIQSLKPKDHRVI